jgi:hypothetical protein
MTAATTERVCKQVKAALAQGQCCVIGLQSTGEAASERSLTEESKGGSVPSGSRTTFVSPTRDLLQRFILDHFPTTLAPDKPPVSPRDISKPFDTTHPAQWLGLPS